MDNIPLPAMDHPDGPMLVMNDNARTYLAAIEDLLAILVERKDLLPNDAAFTETWNRITDLYSRYEGEILSASGMSSMCHAGCGLCCFHWVEDVYSFEAEMIMEYIRRNFPGREREIVTACLDDTEAFDSLGRLVDQRLEEYDTETDDIADPYELLLACYYRLRRPCPLLSEDGRCSIYPVRPLTCRTYMNMRDPAVCEPDVIEEEDPATFIMGLSDRADKLMEILHHRHDTQNDCRSLRILMLSLLPGKD